jgi:hypothetical protein
MIRTFGTIPTITALQIATASFAVPKSVIKTIVGGAAGLAVSTGVETPPQPISKTAMKNVET